MTLRANRVHEVGVSVRRHSAWFVVCLLLCVAPVAAADFLEGFDGPQTSWTIATDSKTCRVVDHLRHDKILRFGTGSENVVFDAQQIARAELTHGLSPARVLDEPLTANVWIRSNRAGAKFSLRLVYPHLTDPETGLIVFRLVDGEVYQSEGKWQMLTCKTSEKELNRRSQLLRAQYGAKCDLTDAYVDRAFISMELGVGATELFIDELKLGPVVSPSADIPVLPEAGPAVAELNDVKMQHDRLLINGKPRFPVILPYHGEPPAELANLGVNMAWVPRHDDRQVIDSLAQVGIGVIATPPLALSPEGGILDAENAGLAPLGEELDPILFWMLGNEIPANGAKRLGNWRKQLLSADRRRHRPLMANITGGERAFSRLVAMLGMSRPVQGTSLDYARYRDWLTDRQLAARPGSFMWTWIDTEYPPELVATRLTQKLIPPVMEPEQLRLQTFSALSSGMRGLGFWSTQGLFNEGAGAAETRLMLKQLQFDMKLLEPWLATGSPVGNAKFQMLRPTSPPNIATAARKPAVVHAGHAVPAPTGKPATDSAHISATLLESDFGTLLLGTWFENDSQFVPGRMAANDVQIVVPGVKETAKFWEVTTTEIRPLVSDRNAVPGGTLIRLQQFELTTAIVISSDLSLGADLRRRMREIQAESATCVVQLARAKLKRVEGVVTELQSLGRAQPDVDRMLKKARQLAETGAKDLERKDFVAARKNGDYALQMLRVLQRAHWDDAVATSTHPISSPHTICFQTLPDHWRMQARIQADRTRSTENLLHSGDFEDEDTFRTAGWQHAQNDVPGIAATAELVQAPGRKGFCLRMAAGVADDKPAPLIIAAAPVTVVTPSVPVQNGQTLRIQGNVKLLRNVSGTRDGFQICDSIGGAAKAIHWTESGEWHRFEILREVAATESVSLKLTLFGIGEVLIDDLKIEPLDLPGASLPPVE
ncbi:MAG: hypothetical protein JWN70_6267 [Planctomycetaceae bacterium]|nr:hypothetical protein [Planctomycetaceae bacterium]